MRPATYKRIHRWAGYFLKRFHLGRDFQAILIQTFFWECFQFLCAHSMPHTHSIFQYPIIHSLKTIELYIRHCLWNLLCKTPIEVFCFLQGTISWESPWTEEEIILRAGMAQSTGYSTNLKPTSPLADEIVWALVLLLLLADMPWPLLATSFKMEVEPNLLLPPSFTNLLIPLPTMFKQGSTCLPCAPLTHPPTTRSSSAAGGRDLCNQL